MRREYPILFAKASTFLAAPILAITTSYYAVRAISQPVTDIYSFAISAFGITAALSGICFTMAPSSLDEPTIRYAGEKFLHSSLLLIESLILIYSRDALNSLPFIIRHNLLKAILTHVIGSIIILVAVAASWNWYWGFSELNRELWKKWEKRVNVINKTVD